MALEAVLFDMDGVLVNSEPLHRKAFHQVFEDLKIHVPTEVYYSFSGASTQHIADKLVEHYHLDVTAQYIIDQKRAYFKDLFFNDNSFDLLPGVRELLEHYRTHGLKMVVASSASQVTIQMVFDRFGIASYFLGRVSGADGRDAYRPVHGDRRRRERHPGRTPCGYLLCRLPQSPYPLAGL